jgi:two-component system, cell cycle sensor histidine kinase and response regulator CckA
LLVTTIDVLAQGFDLYTVVWQGGTIVMCGVAFVLAGRGQLELASGLTLAAIWLELHAGLPRGGVALTSIMVFPTLIAGAGLLLGGRGGYGLAALTSITVPLTVWVGARVFGPTDTELGYAVYLTTELIAVMFVSAGIVDLAVRALGSVVRSTLAGERRIRELVAHSPDGIMALSASGEILSANPVAERLLATAAADLVGRDADRVLLGCVLPNAESADVTSIIDPLGSVTLDLSTSGRGPLPVDITSTSFARADGSEGIQVTLRDATERVRAAERELEMATRLEESNRLDSVGRLAGGIAHDFNNHLTAIGAGAELLLQDDPGDVKESARLILEAKMRAARLTRGLVAFARKQVISPRTLRIDDVVRDSAPLLKSLLGDGIELDVRITATPAVQADRNQIEQSIFNLISNAKDALGGAGKVTMAVAPPGAVVSGALAEYTVPEGHVELRVEDGGSGMDPAVARRAFEPFFTTAAFGERTGLGLAVVHGIVSQNGGAVHLDSEPGRGTAVRILWPVEED